MKRITTTSKKTNESLLNNLKNGRKDQKIDNKFQRITLEFLEFESPLVTKIF